MAFFLLMWRDIAKLVQPLQQRHHERDGVSNHRRYDCLPNRLFRWKSKLRVTGLREGNSPVTGESPHKGPVMWKRFPFNDVIMSEKMEHWADGYTRPHGWAMGCHNVDNYENIFTGPTYTMISSFTVISNFEMLRGHRCSKPFTAVPGVKVTNVWNVKYFVDRKKYVSFTLMICASTHHILHHIWILISVKQV